ncbi:MAG TPA: hypothetical protein VHL78_09585, partial [Actinomycetota bacterium]|nr:hypothetical protein [Actinomycetota bacterium]
RAALPAPDANFAEPAETSRWRGIWPQDTRADAEAAQAAADAGDPAATWQLDPVVVVHRFGLNELGWYRSYVQDARPEDLAGSPGPHTLTIADCPGDPPRACPTEARVTVDQLLRPGDPSGIWFVTAFDETSAEAATEARVRRFVEDFLTARNMGSASLVEDMVSRQAMDQYEAGGNGLALYGPVDDPAFTGYEFSIDEITEIDGAQHEAFVRITERFEDRSGETFIERLVVGRGEAVRGDPLPLVVLEAYRVGPPPGDPQMASEDAVRDFVQAFLQARLAGVAAEDHLSPTARDQYARHERGLYLYGEEHERGPGFNYSGGDVISVEAVDTGSFEVLVALTIGEQEIDRTIHETLIVRRSDGAAADFAPWTIDSATGSG